MDYFESIAKRLLEKEGYWVRQSYKVELTTKQKTDIAPEKFSIPRPEIDLVAFSVERNEVVAFECKSLFDSGGVRLKELAEDHSVPTGRFKMFTCQRYREIVLEALLDSLVKEHLVTSSTTIKIGLIAGNVKDSEVASVRDLFESNGWVFWSPDMVREKVSLFESEKYENDPAVITAKIILRKKQ